MATTSNDGAYEEVIKGRMQMMRDKQNADLMERQRENERRRQVFEENSRAFDEARRREQNGNQDGNISSFSAYNDENGHTVRYNGEGGREPTSWTSRNGNRPLSWNDAAMQQQMLANQSVFDRISGSTKSARKSERDRQNMQNNVLASMMALAAEDGNGGMLPPESLTEINSLLGNKDIKLNGAYYNADTGNFDLIGSRNGGSNETVASYDLLGQLSTFAGAPGIGGKAAKKVYDDLVSKGYSPETILAKTKYRLPEPADGGWKGDIERGKLENQKLQIESRERMQGMRSAREKIDTEKLAAMRDDIADLQKKVDDAGDKASKEDVAMLRRMKALHRSYIWGDSLDQAAAPSNEQIANADEAKKEKERQMKELVQRRLDREHESVMNRNFQSGFLTQSGMDANGSLIYTVDGGRTAKLNPGDTIFFGDREYVWKGGNSNRESFVPKAEWDKQQQQQTGNAANGAEVGTSAIASENANESAQMEEASLAGVNGGNQEKKKVPGITKRAAVTVTPDEKSAIMKYKKEHPELKDMRDTDILAKYGDKIINGDANAEKKAAGTATRPQSKYTQPLSEIPRGEIPSALVHKGVRFIDREVPKFIDGYLQKLSRVDGRSASDNALSNAVAKWGSKSQKQANEEKWNSIKKKIDDLRKSNPKLNGMSDIDILSMLGD